MRLALTIAALLMAGWCYFCSWQGGFNDGNTGVGCALVLAILALAWRK